MVDVRESLLVSRRSATGGGRRPDASGLRFGIVASDYHPGLSRRLLDGAVRCLSLHRVDVRKVPIFRVPGTFEIPQAASRLLRKNRDRFDALICLGVLIRGETPHFDLLAQEVCRGIGETARRTRVPLAFGVLTVENEGQARERSGKGSSNKGWEAAHAAMRMALLYRGLKKDRKRREGSR